MANAGRNDPTIRRRREQPNLKTHAAEEIVRLRQEVSALSHQLQQLLSRNGPR